MLVASQPRHQRNPLVPHDFQGRMDKIEATLPMSRHALFEAIANSVDAYGETPPPNSIVTVRVLRHQADQTMKTEYGEKIITGQVSGYEVVDGGEGFTDNNYTAFQTIDTRNKKRRGGKGVGRLLWLHVFDTISISSVYREDGEFYARDFSFAYADDADKLTTELRAAGKNELRTLKMPGKPSESRTLGHFFRPL